MATKTQNFYGVILSSIVYSLAGDQATVTFPDEKGFIVTRKTRKKSLDLAEELGSAMNCQYPIDIIVDGRGSISWIRAHGFDYDLQNHTETFYEVWIFSPEGSQVRLKGELNLSEARVLADSYTKGIKVAPYGWSADSTYKVVRSSTTYEVVD